MASECTEKSKAENCSEDLQEKSETNGIELEDANSLPAPSKPASLELLALVSEWRIQHGLKHDDYTRYRRSVGII